MTKTSQERTPTKKKKTPFERREEIVGAALQCFHKKGLRATTMQDIARACDISVSHVYTFFDSKDSVVEAVVTQYIDGFLAKSELPWDLSAESLESDETLRQALKREFSRRSKRDELLLMLDLFSEAIENERINACVRAATKKARQHAMRMIENNYQRRGKKLPEDFESRVAMSFAAFEGMLLQSIMNPALKLGDMSAASARVLACLLDQGA